MKNITKPSLTRYVSKCPSCDTEFTYNRSDIETVIINKCNERMVRCPNCCSFIFHRDRIGTNHIEIMKL